MSCLDSPGDHWDRDLRLYQAGRLDGTAQGVFFISFRRSIKQQSALKCWSYARHTCKIWIKTQLTRVSQEFVAILLLHPLRKEEPIVKWLLKKLVWVFSKLLINNNLGCGSFNSPNCQTKILVFSMGCIIARVEAISLRLQEILRFNWCDFIYLNKLVLFNFDFAQF